MKIGKILYFSPNYKFWDLKWDEKENLIDAFKDRVKGFYIQPAEKLNKDKKGFAAGVLCITTIDFLTKIDYKERNKIKNWLKDNINDFKKPDPNYSGRRSLADRFYNEFRDGLIHEGRIKSGGQFSYDYQELIKLEDKVMIVNPDILLLEINNFFNKFIIKINRDDTTFYQFRDSLRNDFIKEIELSKK